MTYPEKMKKFKSDFYKNVTAKARENISTDSSLDLDTELEKLFIKFIKTHETDMGIGIYKGTEQNGNYIWNNL